MADTEWQLQCRVPVTSVDADHADGRMRRAEPAGGTTKRARQRGCPRTRTHAATHLPRAHAAGARQPSGSGASSGSASGAHARAMLLRARRVHSALSTCGAEAIDTIS